MRGDGPPYIKIGRSIRYIETALMQWMKSRQRLSTSEQCSWLAGPSEDVLTDQQFRRGIVRGRNNRPSYTSVYIKRNQVVIRLGTNIDSISVQYILDVFPNCNHIYLRPSPSILSA